MGLTALALLLSFENYFGSSKAAATAGFAEGKTATSCAGVKRPHLRNQRFFLMGLEIWKHIVIQGFARKLNNHIFPGSGYMRKTADNADAG